MITFMKWEQDSVSKSGQLQLRTPSRQQFCRILMVEVGRPSRKQSFYSYLGSTSGSYCYQS